MRSDIHKLDQLHIFVSYTLRDGLVSEASLQKIAHEAQHYGEVYVDLLHNTDPEPQRYVMERLFRSSLFLACLSPAYLRSPWTRDEIFTALALGIPIAAVDAVELGPGELGPCLGTAIRAALDAAPVMRPESATALTLPTL